MSLTPLGQIQDTDNIDLYDSWAETYDSDGNVLQMLDNPAFDEIVIPLLQRSRLPLRILELGCGTGRNTVKLNRYAPAGSTIFATDISQRMMARAKQKIQKIEEDKPLLGDGSGATAVEWAVIDLQTQQKELREFIESHQDSKLASSKGADDAHLVDVVISTLVLEHVELEPFFSVVASVLKPGAWVWATDMHPGMGTSRAGYRRAEDGVKVSGLSFNHGIQEKVECARRFGLALEGEIDERGVGDDEDEAILKFGARAKKWVGKQMFCGMLLRNGIGDVEA